MRKKILKLEHHLIKETGEVAAEALFTVGCFDLDRRKLITPDPQWFHAVAGISA